MPSRIDSLGARSPIKKPPQPYEDPGTKERRAWAEKMKAQSDADWKRRMRPLPDSVMSRPGSPRPRAGIDFKKGEQRYSFGAQGEELTASQYRERTGKEPPSGWKERQMRGIDLALNMTGVGRAKTAAKAITKGLGYVAKAVAGSREDDVPLPTRSFASQARDVGTDILTRPKPEELAQRKSKTEPTS